MTREQNIVEIDQAINAGLAARRSLELAEDSLDRGRKWGIWDMLGGGLISSVAKHSRVNDAQRYLNDAQRELQVFQRELNDVKVNINYGVGFDTFTQVADVVFDGLLVDILVQSQIKESKERVRQTIIQVNATLDKLYAMKKEL